MSKLDIFGLSGGGFEDLLLTAVEAMCGPAPSDCFCEDVCALDEDAAAFVFPESERQI